TIAKWDGSTWTTILAGVSAANAGGIRALAVFDDRSQPALYAAGKFAIAAGVPVGNIARWHGTSCSAAGHGLEASRGRLGIRSMAVFDDGSGPALYAGGGVFLSGGFTWTSGVVRWNGSAWSAVGSGIAGAVNSLAVFDDGTGAKLIAGGGINVGN